MIATYFHDLRTARTPIEHSFQLIDKKSIYSKPQRFPPLIDDIVKAEIDKLLAGNVSKPCLSPWEFPVLIVSKSDGSSCFCVDSRLLNARMKAERYQLPNMEEIIDSVGGRTYFTTMDILCASGKFQFQKNVKH